MIKYIKWFAIGALIGLAVSLLTSMSNTIHPTTNEQIASTTVMITNLAENSGGTGVVLSSNPFESFILTNAHVCGVVKFGGVIQTDKFKGTVTSYQVSELHDLCLIRTNVNLKINTEVAKNAPELYSEAIVSGHPHLLPTLLTKGHFSKKVIIEIMTGTRPCTKEELESPLGVICAFLGAIPVVKTYQAQVVSSLIQPGSSGSAVFNSSGYISGLVFAGAGDLSFGHIVPHEYVYNFVNREVKTLDIQFPKDNTINDVQVPASTKLKNACLDTKDTLQYQIVKDYCKFVKDDIFE